MDSQKHVASFFRIDFYFYNKHPSSSFGVLVEVTSTVKKGTADSFDALA
jgi:hypothetical protein